MEPSFFGWPAAKAAQPGSAHDLCLRNSPCSDTARRVSCTRDACRPITVPHTTRSVRITAIIASENVSGPGRQLCALGAALIRAGVDFDVVILHRPRNPSPALAAHLDGSGVPHHIVEDRGPLDPGLPGRLARLFERLQPDLIQTHNYKATAAAWLLRRFGSRLPWIGFFHGETHEDVKARFYHWLDHRMLASADRVVVMSARQKACLSHSRQPCARPS